MMPMIVDAVRQEVSKIQVISSHNASQKASTFVIPEFIPNINIDGMKSNVKGEERTASGGDVAGSLEALKRLRKSA
jgi:hypothetical protein